MGEPGKIVVVMLVPEELAQAVEQHRKYSGYSKSKSARKVIAKVVENAIKYEQYLPLTVRHWDVWGCERVPLGFRCSEVLHKALKNLAKKHKISLNDACVRILTFGITKSMDGYLDKKPVILRNAVKCLTCNRVVESFFVHDFVTCRCGRVSVDGGRDYLRRSNAGPYEALYEFGRRTCE